MDKEKSKELSVSGIEFAARSYRGGKMAKVKVYSTPTCPYCIKAKAYLKEKGVEFENVDVSENEEGLQEMMKVSGQMGVPVISIDGDIVVGFDRNRIDAKLGV